MRNDAKSVRGLGVAMVSVFLVAGAAFAADGLTRSRDDSATSVGSTMEPNETGGGSGESGRGGGGND